MILWLKNPSKADTNYARGESSLIVEMSTKPRINGRTESQKSQAERESIRALAGLVGLAARLHRADSAESLLREFRSGLADIWAGSGVRLYEVQAEAGWLVPLDNCLSDPIPVRESLLGRLALGRASRFVSDLDNEPLYARGREAPPGVSWRSLIASPIPLEGDPQWVVGVFLPAGSAAGIADTAILERAVTLLEPLLKRWETQVVRLGAFRAIARSVASAVDARDPHLVGHGSRVSDFAQSAARVHGLTFDFVERLGLAGLLHDLGRLAIPESVLSKPGALTYEEFRVVRAHPDLSVRFLSGVQYLADVLPAIRHHHERFDGKGYPGGLEGEDIPLAARLLAVADAFDAMTSPRPFREPLSDSEALAELEREKGRQFDPIIVEAFLRAYEEKLIVSQNVLRADDPLGELRLSTAT